MGRAILCVLDSVGCGGAPDAAAFGDAGANTLGHILREAAAGRADEGRSGPMRLPHLDALGLGRAIRLASGAATPGLDADAQGTLSGRWGAATEVSQGKDTPSGHWELAGVPVPFDWHYFPRTDPAFPPALTQALIARAGLPGILGNRHAAGIPILRDLGEQHLRSGCPICYTSVDSVLQIAAHETAFGLERLYEVCEIAAELVHPMRVGRVIARPFLGRCSGDFTRTANRRDYAIPPPEPTICDRVAAVGGEVWGIGKIRDIFAGRGITHIRKGACDMAHVDLTLEAMRVAAEGALIFANFVDFDTLYGHTRDVAGYARNLEAFDARVPELIAAMRAGDLLIFTADHGNDPTHEGTDHTRERVPVLIAGAGRGGFRLRGFADVGVTLAAPPGLAPGRPWRRPACAAPPPPLFHI